MEESNVWANLNCKHNEKIIFTEIQALKEYIPKKENNIIKRDTIKKVETNQTNIDLIKGILEADYRDFNILHLICKQNNVANHLLKTFRSSKSEDISWEKFRPGLLWILDTSKHIISKTSLIIHHFGTDKIYRSSYKFCNKKEECEALYCQFINNEHRQSYAKCSGDHYVHYKLISDLTCLIKVLDERNGDMISNDLRICLDTINFVINHMYQELNNVNLYNSKQEGFDINRYYITSIPKRK